LKLPYLARLTLPKAVTVKVTVETVKSASIGIKYKVTVETVQSASTDTAMMTCSYFRNMAMASLETEL
jgi:acyl-CoA thioesterase FadM